MARRRPTAKQVKARRVASYLALERDVERVAEWCRETFGSSDREARELIRAAREELASAADVDQREELGRRREQLEDLRKRAKEGQDLRVELAAIQELSKLLDLYKTSTMIDASAEVESAAVSLARRHLEGLAVAPTGLPIEELARVVALNFKTDGKTAKTAKDDARLRPSKGKGKGS